MIQLVVLILILIIILSFEKKKGGFEIVKEVIFIFRRDLRLEDNTTLNKIPAGVKVIPVFIFDPRQIESNEYKSDKALNFMLSCLRSLENKIKSKSGNLIYLYGDPATELEKLKQKTGATKIFYNKDYTEFAKERDSKLGGESYHDLLLLDEHHNYKKFTPFYNKFGKYEVRKPHTSNIKFSNYQVEVNEKVKKLFKSWNGEAFENRELVLKKLKEYDFSKYDENRKLFGETTKISAYLKFGTISIREVYYTCDNDDFKRELWWRDFYYGVAQNDPNLLKSAYYDNRNWWSGAQNLSNFEKWCKGETGFVVIDKHMKELNETGYMNGRGRMYVADFLIKLMDVDWRLGEKYFAQHLIDYDPIINNYNWQWIAGTAPFSQPRFRVFNPTVWGVDNPIIDYKEMKEQYLKKIKN